MNRRSFLKNIGWGAAAATAAAAIPLAPEHLWDTMLQSGQVVTQDEEYAYYWYCKSEMDVHRQFEDRMEAQLLEGNHLGATWDIPEYPEDYRKVLEETGQKNFGQIFKDSYEVTGSDATQIQWVKIPLKHGTKG